MLEQSIKTNGKTTNFSHLEIWRCTSSYHDSYLQILVNMVAIYDILSDCRRPFSDCSRYFRSWQFCHRCMTWRVEKQVHDLESWEIPPFHIWQPGASSPLLLVHRREQKENKIDKTGTESKTFFRLTTSWSNHPYIASSLDTVDGSEIRRSPPGMLIKRYQLVIAAFLNHHFICLNLDQVYLNSLINRPFSFW